MAGISSMIIMTPMKMMYVMKKIAAERAAEAAGRMKEIEMPEKTAQAAGIFMTEKAIILSTMNFMMN